MQLNDALIALRDMVWGAHALVADRGSRFFSRPCRTSSPRFTGLLLARVTTGGEIYEIRYHLVNAALSFDLFDNLMLRPLRQHS